MWLLWDFIQIVLGAFSGLILLLAVYVVFRGLYEDLIK
tara:strand:+ start:505 stop:618 length:114 start_codon:yes stop_codon:yes gene_type:complete